MKTSPSDLVPKCSLFTWAFKTRSKWPRMKGAHCLEEIAGNIISKKTRSAVGRS